MTAIASPQSALDSASRAGAGDGDLSGVDSAPRPLPGEPQAQFAMRFHAEMESEIPETEARNDAMLDAWEKFGDDGGLLNKARKRFNSSEYRRVRNVPVFAEHSTKRITTNPQTGEKREEVVVYDRSAMEVIADRCNSRIRDTGDFAPLTDGHTPTQDEIEAGIKMPEVLGYDGPFRVGLIGNDDPRWAIFADEWHQLEDEQRLRRLRRRSPEVWKEERMEDRILDPIAALGAETPRLDMGPARYAARYARSKISGRTIERYTSFTTSVPTATGANTTYVPGGSGDDDRKDRYEPQDGSGDSGMTEQEIDAIAAKVVQQVCGSKVWQWGEQKMAAEEAAAAASDGEAGDMDGGEMDDAAGFVAAVPEMDTADVAATAGDAGDMGGGADDGRGGEPAYEPDEEDVEQFRRYMAGEVSDEEMSQYAAGKRGRHKTSRYSADDGDGDVEGTETSPDSGSVVGDEVDQYGRRRGMPANTPRERREEVARYQKLQDRVNRLEKERDTERSERRKAERYSKLSHLRTHYAFDLEEEAADTAEFTDSQFERHLDRIQDRYHRIPVGAQLHVPADAEMPKLRERSGERKEATQDEAAAAVNMVDRYRRDGKDISYDDALIEVRKKPDAPTATKTA